MSLSLFDPYFTADFQFMERQLGIAGRDDSNGEFKYTCNFQGFAPENIKVHQEGRNVVLEAERKHTGQLEHFERSLKRVVKLPDDVNEQSLKCEMNERGELILYAQKSGEPLSYQESPIPLQFNDLDDQFLKDFSTCKC